MCYEHMQPLPTYARNGIRRRHLIYLIKPIRHCCTEILGRPTALGRPALVVSAPDVTDVGFPLSRLENDMSNTNELHKIIKHLPFDVHSDLMRYGIEVVEMEAIDCGDLPAIADEPAAPVTTEGCVVHYLDLEVITYDVPVGNWMEVTTRKHKEDRHGQVAR